MCPGELSGLSQAVAGLGLDMVFQLLLGGVQHPVLLLLQQGTGIFEGVSKEARPCFLLAASAFPDPLHSPQVCEPGSDLVPQDPQALLFMVLCFFSMIPE